jgi:hypothetical protein
MLNVTEEAGGNTTVNLKATMSDECRVTNGRDKISREMAKEIEESDDVSEIAPGHPPDDREKRCGAVKGVTDWEKKELSF